jgi:hypothetical protein
MKMEITRVLKNDGFTKHYKGYIKNVNHLIKMNVLDISETEKIGKFKIMIGINPEKTIELSKLSHVLGFMGYVIPKGKSFITINENTNTEELRICVRNYLNDILSILNIYNDVKKIIKELQIKID